MNGSKERWVSIGKCIAILAVITDHLRNSLYSSEGLGRITYFSVSFFILLMGVTVYWSFDSSVVPLWHKVTKRLVKIIVPYIAAAFVYHCISNRGFYWWDYWNSLVHFNASGPHYYVLLYLQLIVTSPVLFVFIKRMEQFSRKKELIVKFAFGIGIGCIARITNLYSDIAGIYAGRMLGGSYILCLYIGMLTGGGTAVVKKKKQMQFVGFLSAFLSMLVMLYVLYAYGFIFDHNALLGSVINPPGITLIVLSVTILISIYYFDSWVIGTRQKKVNKIGMFMAYLGNHTLYIFLYHRLFLDYFLNKVFSILNIWIKIPIYYFTMIVGSIIIEKIFIMCKRIIIQSYLYRRE